MIHQMNTLLTVIVPSYNRKKLLTRAIDNLLLQLHPSVEVLVVLDPSGDGSEEVVRKSGVRYIINPIRLGFAKSFDIGVANANGVYCWLLGDDDVLQPYAIQNILNTIDMFWPGIILSLDGSRTWPNAPYGRHENVIEWVKACLQSNPCLLCEDMALAARIFRRSLYNHATAERFAHTHFGHIYATTRNTADIYLLDKPLYSILPQEMRPVWSSFPSSIDNAVVDYMHWLSQITHIPIDANLVLSDNRRAFRQSLANPLTFFMKHYRAAFKLSAWRYLFNRLFFSLLDWIMSAPQITPRKY